MVSDLRAVHRIPIRHNPFKTVFLFAVKNNDPASACADIWFEGKAFGKVLPSESVELFLRSNHLEDLCGGDAVSGHDLFCEYFVISYPLGARRIIRSHIDRVPVV